MPFCLCQPSYRFLAFPVYSVYSASILRQMDVSTMRLTKEVIDRAALPESGRKERFLRDSVVRWPWSARGSEWRKELHL